MKKLKLVLGLGAILLSVMSVKAQSGFDIGVMAESQAFAVQNSHNVYWGPKVKISAQTGDHFNIQMSAGAGYNQGHMVWGIESTNRVFGGKLGASYLLNPDGNGFYGGMHFALNKFSTKLKTDPKEKGLIINQFHHQSFNFGGGVHTGYNLKVSEKLSTDIQLSLGVLEDQGFAGAGSLSLGLRYEI